MYSARVVSALLMGLLTAAFMLVVAEGAPAVPTIDPNVTEWLLELEAQHDPPPALRFIYAAPSDRDFSDSAAAEIRGAALDFQEWLHRELDGYTFTIAGDLPQRCAMPQPHAHYYGGYTWPKVVTGLQDCAPVSRPSSGQDYSVVWVVFVDVEETCTPRQLNRGFPGLTLLGLDLDVLRDCTHGVLPWVRERWSGRAAHEIGHALALLHPPGCRDIPGTPCIGGDSLMWRGWANYPATHLTDRDKQALMLSPFIRRAPR